LGAGAALLINFPTAVVCGVIGLFIGGIAALPLGGTLISSVIMRMMDIILAFPGILLAIAIVAMLGPGLDKGMIAIGIVSIPMFARLARSTVLSVVREEYVTAALSVGVPQGRILFRHITPNTLSPRQLSLLDHRRLVGGGIPRFGYYAQRPGLQPVRRWLARRP